MALEKFHYETLSGETIKLPKFDDIPMGVIRKARKLDSADQTFTVLETVCDEETLELVDLMAREEFNAMMVKWRDSSEATLGE